MDIFPIPNEPAMLVKGSERILVIADVHLGIEEDLAASGIRLPDQTDIIISKIDELCSGHEIDRLVIIGDLKHGVPVTGYKEKEKVPYFFERVLGLAKVDFVLGNHDAGIRDLVPPGVSVHPSRGFNMENIGLCHGHAWPLKSVMEHGYLFTAHNHPVVVFRDGLEIRSAERCWVRFHFREGTLDERYPGADPELVLFPSFNKYLGGNPVNETGRDGKRKGKRKKTGAGNEAGKGKSGGVRFLGPLLTNDLVDIEGGRVFLLDGTYLGKIGSLMLD